MQFKLLLQQTLESAQLKVDESHKAIYQRLEELRETANSKNEVSGKDEASNLRLIKIRYGVFKTICFQFCGI